MVHIKLDNETWRPDRAHPVPIVKQIYDYIVSKIASGAWSVGSRMPTQMAMARCFEVNRSTVVAVYEQLKADGIIVSKTKAGTVIMNNTWSLLASRKAPDWTRKISGSLHRPNLDIVKIINDIENDKGFIRLGVGELADDLVPLDRLKTVALKTAGYDAPKGLYELRCEVARYLKGRGIETDPSKILIVSGALQALNLIALGLLHRGATVLTEKPSYLQSLTLFETHQIKLTGVKMDPMGIDLADLAGKVAVQKPALLYTIPNYHNPTGVTMSEERRLALRTLCEKEGLAIVEDDVYSELWLDGAPPFPLKGYDANGAVLYIGSVSKSLSAGLRIGWVVGNENVIDRLADIKMQTDYGSSNLSQWLCYEWLKSGAYAAYTAALRQVLKGKRTHLCRCLAHHFKDLATWDVPRGGLYIWLRLKASISLYKLFEACYRQGVIINPGFLYDSSEKHAIRLSFSYATDDEMTRGIEVLAEAVKALTQ